MVNIELAVHTYTYNLSHYVHLQNSIIQSISRLCSLGSDLCIRVSDRYPGWSVRWRISRVLSVTDYCLREYLPCGAWPQWASALRSCAWLPPRWESCAPSNALTAPRYCHSKRRYWGSRNTLGYVFQKGAVHRGRRAGAYSKLWVWIAAW